MTSAKDSTPPSSSTTPPRPVEDIEAKDAATPLEHTGERTLPDIEVENYWFRRHEIIYRDLERQLDRRQGTHPPRGALLDAGVGEGYGAAMLAPFVDITLGLDYDRPTCAHLLAKYPAVHPLRGNLVALPLGTDSVDVIVNSQVIEHLWDQGLFLRECRRILRPGGELIITTPNRLTFTPEGQPINPFHTRELDAAELVELVSAAGLGITRLAGVYHGPRLADLDARWSHHGGLIGAQLHGFLSGEGWSNELWEDVRSVTAEDFVVRDVAPATGAPELADCLDLYVVATPPSGADS